MADVRRPPTRPSHSRSRDQGQGNRSSDDDRGQLFLVAALSLAVLFVGFALLLNTAIFTENLATRNTDPGTDPSISYRAAATDAARDILIEESANNTDDKDWDDPTGDPQGVKQLYERAVANWSDTAGIHSARRARVASVSVDTAEHGTRITQTNASRNFTNRSYTPTYEVADDVAVRDVQFTVDQDSIVGSRVTTLANSPFRVDFENAADTWSVYVYDDLDTGGDDVTVAVVNDTNVAAQCTHPGSSPAHIDVTNASVNGTACPALELLDMPDADLENENVEVSFANADNVAGTYGLTVSSGLSYGSGENFYDNDEGPGPEEGSPFITAVVYEATITVTYESTDVYYRTTIDIEPPEEIR
jgi:hypothetical protein